MAGGRTIFPPPNYYPPPKNFQAFLRKKTNFVHAALPKIISRGGNPLWPPVRRRKSIAELNFGGDPVCFLVGQASSRASLPYLAPNLTCHLNFGQRAQRCLHTQVL
jgi:hypothetical protein